MFPTPSFNDFIWKPMTKKDFRIPEGTVTGNLSCIFTVYCNNGNIEWLFLVTRSKI